MQPIYHVCARYVSYAAIFLLSFAFDGCTDHQTPPPPSTDPPTGDFSDDIKKAITQDNIDKIRELGVNVCEGQTVTNVEGVYFMAPNIKTKTTVPGDNANNFYDYIYRFKNQTTDLKIEVDYKSDGGGDVGLDIKGFISGNGTCFTIFVLGEGQVENNKYRALTVYSGEKTATGIKNLQNAFLMLEDYGDPNDIFIPVNTGRAFKDGNGFSESRNSFRKAAKIDGDVLYVRPYFRN
ncbi:hypothetical protein [Spirosoma validum]|uniref:Uncharacterized protein n=1 Tax=Spirosoma validum TaxID=2771355 RepID=A0A927B0C2_9BACT|nr:hypothetical protein [Spirosoma validum]MBD2752952.1 hypothetical protein [Spirosoma validum]